MDEKTLRKLQQDIGRITKDHSLSAAAGLEKLLDGITLTDEDIGSLLMPVCANCSTETLDILLAGADALPDAKGLVEHTLRFRHKDESFEKKQVYIIDPAGTLYLPLYSPECSLLTGRLKLFVFSMTDGSLPTASSRRYI